MSLIYKRKANQSKMMDIVYDYLGEIRPFVKRIDKKWSIPLMVFLKTIEWSIYRWYKTPTRRFYGIKGNELIYMITSRCNERCAKCGIWKNPEPVTEHLKVTAFIDCLRALHHNLYQITLTGGEPLLYQEDVLLIAEEAANHKVPMVIVTNGVLVTEFFLERYAKLGHKLVFSIDTLEKEKWEAFRGKDSYDKVMTNLQLAYKFLGKNLRIQSVYAEETKDDIPKIKGLCKQMDIKHVSQPYMDFGGVWHVTKQMSEKSEKKDDVICAARKNICIYPNGDVVKCFDHYRIPLAKEPLGNIGKESIIEILCKKRATEISKIMKTCNFSCKYLSCNIPEIAYE
jgi:MoaA/NifB/PqqE/SkfB family radical SAM enzyme